VDNGVIGDLKSAKKSTPSAKTRGQIYGIFANKKYFISVITKKAFCLIGNEEIDFFKTL